MITLLKLNFAHPVWSHSASSLPECCHEGCVAYVTPCDVTRSMYTCRVPMILAVHQKFSFACASLCMLIACMYVYLSETRKLLHINSVSVLNQTPGLVEVCQKFCPFPVQSGDAVWWISLPHSLIFDIIVSKARCWNQRHLNPLLILTAEYCATVV